MIRYDVEAFFEAATVWWWDGELQMRRLAHVTADTLHWHKAPGDPFSSLPAAAGASRCAPSGRRALTLGFEELLRKHGDDRGAFDAGLKPLLRAAWLSGCTGEYWAQGICMECLCTEFEPCDPVCGWADDKRNLCTGCVPSAPAARPIVGIACSRGRGCRPIVGCDVPGCPGVQVALCDYPVAPGRTCDVGMCTDHRTVVGDDLDHCPGHARRG